MDTIKKAIDRHKYVAAFLFAIIALVLVMGLAGCSTAVVEPDPAASAATVDEVVAETEEQTPPPVNEFVKQFGEVVSYEDGISISVALVGPFTPSNLEYFPLGEGETAVLFKVVLTNNSEAVFEPGAVPNATSGGKTATYISDVGNPEYGDIGLFPVTSLLPGQTLEWYAAFGVADPADITFEIGPGPFDYQSAIFTNVPF